MIMFSSVLNMYMYLLLVDNIAFMFHSLIVQSKPHDAKSVPSELNANEVMLEVWPLSSVMGLAEVMSHSVIKPLLAGKGVETKN